jgi:hypothetical protein
VAVAPARVLKIVRDHGPLSSSTVLEHLGSTAGGQRVQLVADQVEAILLRLEAAGLVVRSTAAGLPDGDALLGQMSMSMTPAAAKRAMELAAGEGTQVHWEMTDALIHLQRALGVSLGDLARRQEREYDPLVQDVNAVVRRVGTPPPADPLVRDQLVPCLREAALCMSAGCHASVLALAGKALELIVKRQLLSLGVEFDDNLMLGPLLGRLREVSAVRADVASELLDPTLGHVANLINQHRISAVHARRAVAPPTEDQARVVLHALLDVTRRLVPPASAE